MTTKKLFLSNPDCPLSFGFLLEPFFWLGDVRTRVLTGDVHSSLYNWASVENKMPQTRIILTKS